MLAVSSVKLKMKVPYMMAPITVVTMQPRVPAEAQPKLQLKYSPEITRPTAIPHNCQVPRVAERPWGADCVLMIHSLGWMAASWPTGGYDLYQVLARHYQESAHFPTKNQVSRKCRQNRTKGVQKK